MYAPRPASTTTRAMVERRPRILGPPLEPGHDPGAEDAARNDEQRQPEDVRFLRRRQRDAAVVRILRTDRDQVVLLREPADGVHEQVAVSGNSERAISGEVRIADHG